MCGSWVRKGKGLYTEEPALLLPGVTSPVCHQHLDSEVGQKNQEGAGCIVFEGGECREPILEAKGVDGDKVLDMAGKVSTPGTRRVPSLTLHLQFIYAAPTHSIYPSNSAYR